MRKRLHGTRRDDIGLVLLFILAILALCSLLGGCAPRVDEDAVAEGRLLERYRYAQRLDKLLATDLPASTAERLEAERESLRAPAVVDVAPPAPQEPVERILDVRQTGDGAVVFTVEYRRELRVTASKLLELLEGQP